MFVLLLTFFVLLFLAFPIFLCMLIASAYYLIEITRMPDVTIVQRFIAGMDNFTLLAVPFFIIAATIMGRGSIGPVLLNLTRKFVAHVYGGLAIAVTTTCWIIGAISGAGTAGIVTIGPLVFGEMKRDNYAEGFAAGLITTASSLAMLIPPSIAGIIFAMVTGTSVAKVFLTGLGTGLLYGFFLMIYSYMYARIKKVPLLPRTRLGDLWRALRNSGWALGLPVVILGGIYSGVFSPTEAAGVSAVYAIGVELLVYRKISPKAMFNLIVEAGEVVAMLYMLISGGTLLAYAINISQVPAMIVSAFAGASKLSILLVINGAFLLAGMLVDPGSAIIILMPLVLPLARMVGIDLTYLAGVVVFNLSIGMYTPPFGLNLFVGAAILKVPISQIVYYVLPFIGIALIVLVLVTLIPEITLFFPKLLM